MRFAGNVARGVKGWLNASLGNRIGAALLCLTLGFILLLGAVNFVYIYTLTRASAHAALDEIARDAVSDISVAFVGIDDDMRNLARNPTIVSAVLDSHGQESYLFPLLSRFQPGGRVPSRLCVTDYKGRSVGCSRQPMSSYEGQRWVAEAVDKGRAAVRIVQAGPNRPILLFAQPVIYEGTGRAEGCVVTEYELQEVLLLALGGMGQITHLRVKTPSGSLISIGPAGDALVVVERELLLGNPFDTLKIRLALGLPNEQFAAPLHKLVGVFALLAVAFSAAVVTLVRYLVPLLTRRLETITRHARQVTETGRFDDADVDDGGDEIAALSRAFASMTRRLREVNRTLEAKVEARTAELRQQQDFLKALVDAVPGIVFQFRWWPDGRSSMPFASEAMLRSFGLAPGLLRDDASLAFEIVHPEDRPALLAAIGESAKSLTVLRHEYRVFAIGGATVWCSISAHPRPHPAADGSVLLHGLTTDVTEHKIAELALAESEAYSKALFENSYIPLVIMDSQSGRIVDCNEAAVSIYGFPDRRSVLGKTPLDVSAPTQYDGTASSAAARAQIAKAGAEGINVFEWRHRRPDGTIWDAEVRLMAMAHRGRKLMQFSLIDITERKRLECEHKQQEDLIWRRANFDALTGLANRSLCRDRLESALAQGRRSGRKVGVLFVDLDGFKAVNDLHGHAVGDELLIDVGSRLTETVREQDTVARLGGDEFVLLIPDLANPEDLARVGEKIVTALQKPFSLAGVVCTLSASVGTALFPDDGADGEFLLDQADQAMYCAKQAGKNCVRAAGLSVLEPIAGAD